MPKDVFPKYITFIFHYSYFCSLLLYPFTGLFKLSRIFFSPRQVFKIAYGIAFWGLRVELSADFDHSHLRIDVISVFQRFCILFHSLYSFGYFVSFPLLFNYVCSDMKPYGDTFTLVGLGCYK